jgi:hypothetical protein
MIFYNYILLDEDDEVFMSTSVDEPNPIIDAEFWGKFMEGGFRMEYIGKTEEEEIE